MQQTMRLQMQQSPKTEDIGLQALSAKIGIVVAKTEFQEDSDLSLTGTRAYSHTHTHTHAGSAAHSAQSAQAQRVERNRDKDEDSLLGRTQTQRDEDTERDTDRQSRNSGSVSVRSVVRGMDVDNDGVLSTITTMCKHKRARAVWTFVIASVLFACVVVVLVSIFKQPQSENSWLFNTQGVCALFVCARLCSYFCHCVRV